MGKRRNCSVTSNFSFSHGVFKRLLKQTHKNQGLFGTGLMVNTWAVNIFNYNRYRRKCSFYPIDRDDGSRSETIHPHFLPKKKKIQGCCCFNTLTDKKILALSKLKESGDKLYWLIDWLNGVLCPFQQYFSHVTATAHIIHVFPGFYQY